MNLDSVGIFSKKNLWKQEQRFFPVLRVKILDCKCNKTFMYVVLLRKQQPTSDKKKYPSCDNQFALKAVPRIHE